MELIEAITTKICQLIVLSEWANIIIINNSQYLDRKQFQIKNWQKGKDQIARTFNQIKGFFVKN